MQHWKMTEEVERVEIDGLKINGQENGGQNKTFLVSLSESYLIGNVSA